jgi:hypothetical protein
MRHLKTPDFSAIALFVLVLYIHAQSCDIVWLIENGSHTMKHFLAAGFMLAVAAFAFSPAGAQSTVPNPLRPKPAEQRAAEPPKAETPQVKAEEKAAKPKRERSAKQRQGDDDMRACGANWREQKDALKAKGTTWRSYLKDCRAEKKALRERV